MAKIHEDALTLPLDIGLFYIEESLEMMGILTDTRKRNIWACISPIEL